VATHENRSYLSVRFGNVLGSRGSVVTAFQDQIARGEPLTVTDPRVTRFFMTVQEACQLVIQAAAGSHRGDTLVLDMGEPVSIDELARTLSAQAGRPATIVYTGLRHGEKLNEQLFGRRETARPGGHPLVMAVDVPPLSPAAVLDAGENLDARAALERLSTRLGDGADLAVTDGLTSWDASSLAPSADDDAVG
jgi:FlaA1/EpsC-like NDP-sugar epimerase